MVRKETAMRLPPQHRALEVKIPSFFRCPISLDVMRSPVSLCTGVTYDRASIQRWLDSGNTTCPATMLPLPSTDLVPNLTLRSLIAHWAASAAASSPTAANSSVSTRTSSPASLVRQIAASSGGADPAPALRELAAYLSDDDVDDFEKNALVGAGRAAEAVASVLRRKSGDEPTTSVEAVEAAARVLAKIVASDGIDDANKKRVAAALAADAAASAASLARVMRRGSCLEARVDAARLAGFLLANAVADDARAAAAESPELVAELVRLIGPVDDKGTLDGAAVEAGLTCLAAICCCGGTSLPSPSPPPSRRAARAAAEAVVRHGAVGAAVRALRDTAEPRAAAMALRVLEAAAGCAEGRAALCERAEEAVGAVVGKMMKAGREGAEAAVAVLWAVCHRYRDRRAAEAAAAAEGGLTRLLLLVQSGCSPAARQMAMELLKMYRVNAKSCLAGYDSKTTHIMPF